MSCGCFYKAISNKLLIGLTTVLIGVACGSSSFAQVSIFKQGFDDNAEGPYTRDLLKKDFPNIAWAEGLDRCYVSGVYSSKHRSLKVTYPKNKFGTADSGAQWLMPFENNKQYTDLVCTYYIKFGEDFDWRRGGKLPGLTGGKSTATGGTRANGSNGWSARIMWRSDGKIEQYAYHMDQKTKFGDYWIWKKKGQDVKLETDKWYQFKTRIKMNDPGKANGICESWLDGEKVLGKYDIRWRDTDDLKIDTFYFSTFYGGANSSWAPNQPTYINFDRIYIFKR